MTRDIGVALLALGLAGCETTPVHELSYSQQQEWAKKIVQRCYDQGLNANSPQLRDCIRAESIRDASVRHRNAQQAARSKAALSAGLRNMSNAYNQSAVYAPSTTTCTRVPSPAGYAKVRCY